MGALEAAATTEKDQGRVAHQTKPALATAWHEEETQLCGALAAAKVLRNPRVNVRTRVTTAKGPFVDVEVSLRPRRPADDAADVLIWFEVKHGADVHDDQLHMHLLNVDGNQVRQIAIVGAGHHGWVFDMVAEHINGSFATATQMLSASATWVRQTFPPEASFPAGGCSG